MKKPALLLLLLSCLLFSCKRYRCPVTVYCSEGYNFVLVGFDTSEIATVILRVYKAGTSFASPIDTGIIIDSVVKQSFNGPVYTWIPLFGTYRDSLLNGAADVLEDYRVSQVDTTYIPYDWEIYIPKDNRTFRVTGIAFSGKSPQTVESCDHKGNKIWGSCHLALSSYTIDGQVHGRKGFDDQYDANFIFLQK